MKNFKELFRTHTKEKVTAVIFVIIIFVMMIGMVTTTEDFGEGFLLTYRTIVPTGAPYLERIEGAIDAAETAVNEGAFLRQEYVELYGLSQLLMNKHIITDYNYGSLYKTIYDQTTFVVSEKYVEDSANLTFPFANNILTAGMDFLYVQLPFKVAPDEYQETSPLPGNVRDYSNQNADNYLAALAKAEVPFYDLRDDFWTSGHTQNELFFDTDHHWTIEGALLATRLIAEYLNENHDFGIEEGLYDPDNFNHKVYEDHFIGSMGRRVGQIYGGVDDFTLITPKFDTDITLTQIEGLNEIVTEGTFEEAVLEMEYIEDPDITVNRYAAYHGDYQELLFINHLTDNDKKVLIIKDSFGIPVYSFLSLGIREVRAIDMRLFEMNVFEYAQEYDPDIVIIMYNADSFADPMFDFNPDINNEEYREWLESL